MASPNAIPSKANKSPVEGERRKTTISENNVKKPTRPLTAYHLFFQLEREYILQTTPATGDPNNEPSRPQYDDRRIGKEIDPAMPCRYRYIRLSPTWHASGSGKRTGGEARKRKHRRTHGKIGFLDLSKTIAERWAGLEENDRATKEYVTRIAGRELEAYRRAAREHKKNNTASADFKVDSMDADEMKLWIKRSGCRSLDGLPNESAGEEVAATASPEKIMGRATAASSYQSQPAMMPLPWLKPEVHSMPYAPAKSSPSMNYEAAARTSQAKSADLKANLMDVDERKLWIKRASSRLLDGMPTKRADEEVATAMLHENTDRATVASSSQSQSAMTCFPWMKPEVNSLSYASEATPSIITTDAEASIGRKGRAIDGNQKLHNSDWNSTTVGKASMPIVARSDTLEKNVFDESSFQQAAPSFWKQILIAEKGGRCSHSSDPGSQLCGSELSSASFPVPGSSAPALCGHSRREAMLPVQPERVRHSFASAPSLFRAGGGGNSGQGNAHCGITNMNYELDAFLSRTDQQRDQVQGRGFDFGGIAPISHRPASAFNDARSPSSIEPSPLRLEDAVGMAEITPDDATGLMKALSDGK